MSGQPVTINSLKYDQTIRRTWQVDLVDQDGSLLIFAGEFDSDVDHPDLGFIPRGTISHEYYWLDRWYNIFRFLESDGSLRNYYCNVSMPSRFQNGVLEYIDLDIDVVVWPDGRHVVLDMNEFAENVDQLSYPANVCSNALEGLTELIDLVASRKFPFDADLGLPKLAVS